MKGILGFSSLPVMGLLGVGLLLAGAQGPWLEFPLSPALHAKDLVSPWPVPGIASFKSLLVLISLVAGLGWLLGLRLITLFAGVAAVAILSHSFCSWILEEQWLLHYLTESEQRTALREFLAQYYWPNMNPEPTTTLESEFEYLHEQVGVFWYAIGWGWVFCLSGASLLLLDSLFSTPVASLSSLTIVVLTGIVIATLLYPVFNAEINHRRGDSLLGSGRPREAIAAYETALHMNPVLQHSNRFLTKASRAFYQLEGEDSILAGLYLASPRIRWVTGQPLAKPVKERLKRSDLILTGVMYTDYHGSLLQTAILRHSAREYIRSLVAQGLDAYAGGEFSVSLRLFQKALASDRQQLHIGFFLAHVQRELGLVADSIATLEEMLDLVDHKSVRADLLCTIGDAFSGAHKPLQAREAYVNCLESDSLFNFRAVLNLGGT